MSKSHETDETHETNETDGLNELNRSGGPRVQALDVAQVAPREVAPGVVSRRLTRTDHARGWLIDFAPGSEWPEVDVHTEEERYYVISGEIIDGDGVFGAGSYVVFDAGTSHRPRSVTGARMLGVSIRVP